MKYQSGNLLLHMKNSKRAGNNAKLQTEKTDTRKHGRGLRSVKRTAEKYGGSLFLEDKGDLFETKLMLTGIAELLGCYIPADFSLHKNRISLHRIEFQRKSGDIKKEMFEWNKIRGVEDEC